MFRRSPLFIQLQQFDQRFTSQRPSGFWRMLMAPGIALTVLALAIIAWPELLAYMIAGLLLFAGITLMLWGWRVRQAERRLDQHLRPLE
ncbi:MAG TPA: hypothetical protein VNP04_28475 [Alphaproteobacteria bacterium]|nr:hypothetical protein [Alphaproteobacteria bacterium]